LPNRETALALVRHWSIIRIGVTAAPPELAGWRIVTKELRENLEWAVVVPGDRDTSPARRNIPAIPLWGRILLLRTSEA
jgi:hypothetical protein